MHESRGYTVQAGNWMFHITAAGKGLGDVFDRSNELEGACNIQMKKIGRVK